MTDAHAAYERSKADRVRALRGTVLEIGAGRGNNFDHLHPAVSWIGIEPNRRRRRALREAARRHGHPAEPIDTTAETLPLPDCSVSGVLSTVVLCSVRDPVRVLHEIVRVLEPGGTFVFAEHVAAPPGTWTRRIQRAVSPVSRALDSGCNPVRDTEALVRASGLHRVDVEHFELPTGLGLDVPYIVGTASRPASTVTEA